MMTCLKCSEKSFIFKKLNYSLGEVQSREFVMVFLAKNLALTGVRGVNDKDLFTSLPFLRCC
jgi:hypothetical protein